MNGYEIARRLREARIPTPILMLTAKDSVPDIVRGLDAGADDYLTKPFAFHEVLARLRALQRRATARPQTRLQVGDLVLDPASREVSRAGANILLTRTEYNLLERLMYRAGKVVPRNALIESVWGFDREIEENTLDAFVRLLRHKVDTDGPAQADPYRARRRLHDSRGVGRVKKLSIGLRLTLWYLAIFLLAEFVFGAGMWLILRKNLYDIADGSLEGQAADLQRFLEARQNESPAQLRQEISEDYQIERSEDYLQISDSDGNWIYRSQFLEEHPLPLISSDQLRKPRYQNRRLGKQPFRILSERMDVGGRVFVVQIGSTLDEEIETLDAFRRYLLMFAPHCCCWPHPALAIG